MVCSYFSSYLELPMAPVDCQVEVGPSRLQHVYKGRYVAMHEIDITGAERKIFHDCVEDLRMR